MKRKVMLKRSVPVFFSHRGWLPVVIAIVGISAVSTRAQSSEPAVPLLDYLKTSSYGLLKVIQPAGYFEIGRRYVHAPRVEWKPVEGATSYQLHLLQGDQVLGTGNISDPAGVTSDGILRYFFREGWDRTKAGKASVVIEAFDANGKRIALSRMFPFYVVPDFNATASAQPKRPYREAAQRAFDALYGFKLPVATPAPTDGPGAQILPVLLSCAGTRHKYASYSFPVLHNWIHLEMLTSFRKIAGSEDKPKIDRYIRSVGDHLLMCRVPTEGWKYGGLVRGCADFQGGSALGFRMNDAELREKMQRLVEPAKCGVAAETLVRVFELTGEVKYLDAAAAMAEVYARTQLEDGSWPARVDAKTGEVLGSYSSSIGLVIAFLDRLAAHRPDERWGAMRERAMAWMVRYPLQTYGWVLNFDDGLATATAANPYQGLLSNMDLLPFVRYLTQRPDQLPNAAARIKEQMDWVDNHFVFYGSDPLLMFEPFYPCCAEQGNPASFNDPMGCWTPMDFHTGNWALTCLAVYRLTKEPIWLAKAKAAGNVLTQYQYDDGGTMTWMCDRTFGVSPHWCGNASTNHNFWPGAWAISVALWSELAAME